MHEDAGSERTAFDDFVARQQKAEAQASSVDWNKELHEWLSQLDRLYSKVESFLAKYVASGQIRYEYKSVQLNEEHIGSYAAREMALRIGPQEVDLVPVGTLLVGAKGRVDVKGPAGRAQLLLVDSKASDPRSLIRVSFGVAGKPPVSPNKQKQKVRWEWRILTRPPDRRFIEITRQAFFDLVMEVANG
jgi:hypothetical protein